MLRTLFAASCLFTFQSIAAGATVQGEWTLWEITLTRTDAAGKVLSEAKAPLAVCRSGFTTRLGINMGYGEETRLWTVEAAFEGGGDKLLEFKVRDSTRTTTESSDGVVVSKAAELFDIETFWRGSGSYPVFTMDGETLTAHLYPAGEDKVDRGEGPYAASIVLIRRDRNGRILSQTSAPWPAAGNNHVACQSLAIQVGAKYSPQTRVVRCEAEVNTLRFRGEELVPVRGGAGWMQVGRLLLHDTRALVNSSGKYLIQELDGEVLEAEIRLPR